MTKEEIYDSQIQPLMKQILTICKSGKIAMIADFKLDDDLKCTSALLDDDYEPGTAQIKAFHLLKPQRAVAFAETIETRPNGSKKITIQRTS